LVEVQSHGYENDHEQTKYYSRDHDFSKP